MGAMLGRLLHNVLVLGSVDHWVNYTFSSSSDDREDEAGSSMHTFYAVDRQQTLHDCTDTLTEDRPGAEDGEDVYEPTIDLTIMEEEEEDRAEETQEVQEDHIPSVDDVLTCSNQRYRPLPDIMFADESEGKPTLPPRSRRRRKAASLHMTEVQQRGCALRRVSTGELHRRMSIEGRCDGAIRTVTTTDGTTQHVRRVRLSLTPFSAPASDIDAQDAMAIEAMSLDVDIPIIETPESASRSSSRASTTRPDSAMGPLQGAMPREGMCRRVTVSVDAAVDGGQPDQVNVDVTETKQAALAPEPVGEMAPEAPVVQCTSDLEAALLRLMTQTARDPDNPAIVTHRRDIHLITAYLANTLGLRDNSISLPVSTSAPRRPSPSLSSRMATASESPVGAPSQTVDNSIVLSGAAEVDIREERAVNTTDNVCGELSEDIQSLSLPPFVANNVTENRLSSPSPVAGVIDPMCVDHNENNMVHSSCAETQVDSDNNTSNAAASAETTTTPVAVARSRKGRRKLRYSALHELPDDVLSLSVALAEEDEVVRDLWSVPCSTGAGESSRPSPALDFFE